MPISNAAFLRSTALLLLAGLVTLLVIVGATLWLTARTEEYSDEVYRARQVRAALVDLRSQVQDAETGQRGFLLTQDPAYLAPYDRARERIGSTLDRFSSLGADAGIDVQGLRATIGDKLSELAETIDLAKQGRLQEALAVVRTDRGKVLMDAARVIFTRMLSEVDDRLGVRMQAQNRSIDALKWATYLGSAMILLVVGGSTWIATRYTRELIAARGELASVNRDLEQRVLDRTSDLSRANEELQRFAYIVSHDLRSPLVNIMGFTTELQELRADVFRRLGEVRQATGAVDDGADARLGQDFDEAIGFIKTSIAKMDGLIAAILKLSREGQRVLAPEPLDLRAIVDGAAANVQHRLTERGGTVSIEGDFPNLKSDRLSVEQVFGNLLDNAVKYSDPKRPPAIVVTGRHVGQRAEVSVKDNGRGIAAADQERVFELFRRAGAQDQPGEGIGLAHVRAAVRRMGGDIKLTSAPGAGSTFTVTLPLTPPLKAAA